MIRVMVMLKVMVINIHLPKYLTITIKLYLPSTHSPGGLIHRAIHLGLPVFPILISFPTVRFLIQKKLTL